MTNRSDWARKALREDVRSGNHTDAFLGHLSEANLSPQEVKDVFTWMAEAASKRKGIEAETVNASVRGVENLTGHADFETERSSGLKKLADFFRNQL